MIEAQSESPSPNRKGSALGRTSFGDGTAGLRVAGKKASLDWRKHLELSFAVATLPKRLRA